MKRLNVQTSPELASMGLNCPEIAWSIHATERAVQKGVRCLYQAEFKPGSIVEVEVEGKKLLKAVIRVNNPVDTRMDDVLVLRPICQDRWLVVSCWQNKKTDTHRTLDKSRINI